MPGNDDQLTAAVIADQKSIGRRVVTALERGDVDVLRVTRRVDALTASTLDAKPGNIVLVCPSSAAATRRAIRELKRRWPGSGLLAVAPAGAAGSARAALAAHANAVVYDEELAATLVPAIRAVSAGLVVLPRAELRRRAPVALSRRERDVLRLVVEGMSNDAIARSLYLSRATVKSHLTSAFAKLDVRSRSEAAAVLCDPAEPASRLVFSPEAPSESTLATAAEGEA